MRSPYGKWAGSPHFGLRDFFEDARQHPERLEAARDELNLSLQELGIRYRVESITREPQPDRDTDSFAFAFAPVPGEEGQPVVIRR